MPSRSNTNPVPEPVKAKTKWTSRVGSAVRKASKKLSISSSSKSGSGDTTMDLTKGASVDIPRSASPDFELISPVNPPASTSAPLATSVSTSTTATTLMTTTTPAGPVSSTTSASSTSTSTPLSLKTPGNASLVIHAPSPIAESPAREADAMMQDVVHGPGLKESSITAELERVEKNSSSSSTIGKLPEIPNIMTSPLYVEPPTELPLVVFDKAPAAGNVIPEPSQGVSPAPALKPKSREPSPAPTVKPVSRSASPSSAVKPVSRSPSPSPAIKTPPRTSSPAPVVKVASRSPSPVPSTKSAPQAASSSSSLKSADVEPTHVKREPSPDRSIPGASSTSVSKVTTAISIPTITAPQAESRPPIARSVGSNGSRPLSIFVEPASTPKANVHSIPSSTPSTSSSHPTISVATTTPSPQPAPTARPQTRTLLIPRPQSQFVASPHVPPGLGPEPILSSGDLVPPIVTIHPATPIMGTRSLQDEGKDDESDSSSDDDEVPYGLVFRPKPTITPTPETASTSIAGASEVKSTPIPNPIPPTTSNEPITQSTTASSSSVTSSIPLPWPLPSDTSSRRLSVSSTSDNEQESDLDSVDVLSSRESTPPVTPPAHHFEFAPMIQVLDANTTDHQTGDVTGKQQWPMFDSEKSAVNRVNDGGCHAPEEPVETGGEDDCDLPNIPSFESPSSLRGSFYSPMSSIQEQRIRNPHGRHGGEDEDGSDEEGEQKVESPFGPVPPMDDIPAIPSIIEPSEESGKARVGVVMLGGHVIGGYAPSEDDVTEKDSDAESGSTHTNMSDVDKREKDFDPEEMRAGAEGVSEDLSKDLEDPFADPMDSNAAWDEHWQVHTGRRRSYSLPQMMHDSGDEDINMGHGQTVSSSDAYNASNPFSSNASGLNTSNRYGSSNTNSFNTSYGSNNPFASKSETQLPILHDLNHALLGTPEPAQRLPPPPVLPYSATMSDEVLGRGSLNGLSSLRSGLSGSVLVAPVSLVASGVGAVGSSSGPLLKNLPSGSSSQVASVYATANPSPAPTPPMIPRPYGHNSTVIASSTAKKLETEIESFSYPYSPPTSPIIPGAYSSPTIPSFNSAPSHVQKVETPQPLRTTTRALTPSPLTARSATPPSQTARAFTPPPSTIRSFTPPPTIPRPYSPQARIYAHGQFIDPSMKRKDDREENGGLAWDPLGSNASAAITSAGPGMSQKRASPPTPPLALPIPFPESTSSSVMKDPLTSRVNANDRDLEKGPGLSPAYSDDIDAEGDIEGEGYVRVGTGNMSPYDSITIGAFSSGYGPLVGSSSPVVGAKVENEEVRLTSVAVGREAGEAKAEGMELEGGVANERDHAERERDLRNPFDSVERLGSTSSITLLNPGGIPLTSTSTAVPGYEQKHLGDSTMSLGSSAGLVDTLPHPNTETTRGSNVRRGSGQFAELQTQRGQNANANGNVNEGDHDYTRWTVIGVVGTLAGVVTTGLLLGLRRIGVGIPGDRLSGNSGNSVGRGGRQREPQFAALDLSSMGRSASTGWMEVGARGRRLISESIAAPTSLSTPASSSQSATASSSSKKPRSQTQPAPSLGMTAPVLGMRRAHSHIPIRSNGEHHPTKMALFLDILHSGPGVIGGLIFGGPTGTSTANAGLDPSLQVASSPSPVITRTTGKRANDDLGLVALARRDSDQNSSSGLIMHVDDSDMRENGSAKGDVSVGESLKATVVYVRDTVVWAFGRVSGWGVTR